MSVHDVNKFVEIFRNSIERSLSDADMQILKKEREQPHFFPSILHLATLGEIDLSIRQAMIIFFKNEIIANWEKPGKINFHSPLGGAPTMPGNCGDQDFVISEDVKKLIRDSIIDAIVRAPRVIQEQIALCINHILKSDFQTKWTDVLEKISMYLQQDYKFLLGALMALHQLLKIYEYKSSESRKSIDESVVLLLPLLYQRVVLLPDESEESALIQKQAIKVFHTFTHFKLPWKLMNKEIFTQWMELFRVILNQLIPETASDPNVYWKCKKWVLHVLCFISERYVTSTCHNKEYKEFAEWYRKTFSAGVINMMLKILEQAGNKLFVDSRVLQLTLSYITSSLYHAFTWKLIKPHILLIIQSILFPLMCYTEQDEDLWVNDPQEYVRLKFDVFEDHVSPVSAAQQLLTMVSKKRKDILPKILDFIVSIMNNPSSDARMKDGALHMVGSISTVLMKREIYKNHLENLLAQYVYPNLQSPSGYLRARSLWCLYQFSNCRFQNEANLMNAIRLVESALIEDTELPVKVQAAVTLQNLIASHEKVQKTLEPRVQPIIYEMLRVIKQTENEDLTTTLQKLVCVYADQIVPIAADICKELKSILYYIFDESSNDDSEKSLAAMGVLNTIDMLLSVMDEHKEVRQQLEPIVVELLKKIYADDLIDLYDEALNIICTITTKSIHPEMWRIYETIYNVFDNLDVYFFGDIMPVLHNFVTVDPPSFIHNPNNMLIAFDMCKKVLTETEPDEEAELYASKLLECMILQFPGQIDEYIQHFVELTIQRLSRKVSMDTLRTQCLQVLIAAFYYNADLFLKVMHDVGYKHIMAGGVSMFDHFVQQWMKDWKSFMGLHDRKMCVLGMITMLNLPADKRTAFVNELGPSMISSILKVFEGLKHAYQAKASAENDEESDIESDDDDDSDVEELDDDEDYSNDNIDQDLDQELNDEEVDDENDSDFEENIYELTPLETYDTPMDKEDTDVDEYVLFKEFLETIQQKDPQWYRVLVSHLTPSDMKAIDEVIVFAERRHQAAVSRKIEKHGGFPFPHQTVPSSFNFGGAPTA